MSDEAHYPQQDATAKYSKRGVLPHPAPRNSTVERPPRLRNSVPSAKHTTLPCSGTTTTTTTDSSTSLSF